MTKRARFAARLVSAQSHFDALRPAQRVRQNDGVFQGLAGALPQIRGRRMDGVAQQGDPSGAPAAPRQAVDHVVAPDRVLGGRLDKLPQRRPPIFDVLDQLALIAAWPGMRSRRCIERDKPIQIVLAARETAGVRAASEDGRQLAFGQAAG